MLRQIAVPLMAFASLAIAPGLQAQDAEVIPEPAKPFTAEETAKYMEVGQQAANYFFGGQADELAAMMTEATLERSGGIDGILQMMDTIAERAGEMLEVKEQKMTRRNGTPQFWFEASFSEFTAEPLVFRWLFDEDGKITGAGITPKSAANADPEGE